MPPRPLPATPKSLTRAHRVGSLARAAAPPPSDRALSRTDALFNAAKADYTAIAGGPVAAGGANSRGAVMDRLSPEFEPLHIR